MGLCDDVWSHEETQDVRPYALTGGRTTPRHSLRLLSQLVARAEVSPAGLVPEAEAALELCQDQPRSVAEVAGHLGLPVLVTKIILSDLIDSGALTVPVTDTPDAPHANTQLLEAVLAGLRYKFPDADAA
jgi:hypothetical protein